ncbi:eukaryotic translation initiation factor 3 subunit E, partial [Rhizophlyctis rosea]
MEKTVSQAKAVPACLPKTCSHLFGGGGMGGGLFGGGGRSRPCGPRRGKDMTHALNVSSKLRERKYRIEKNVVRTDRTVPFFLGAETYLANAPPIPRSEEVVQSAVFSKNLEMLKNVLMTYTMFNFDLGCAERRGGALARFEELQDDTAEILNKVQDPNVIQQLKQDKIANAQFLKDNYGFELDMLTSLYNSAMYNFAVGFYQGAVDMVYNFRILYQSSSNPITSRPNILPSNATNYPLPTAIPTPNLNVVGDT